MLKRFAIGVLGAIALCTSAIAEITVVTQPAEILKATVGHSFGVELVVRWLGDGVAPSLGVYDIDITFDPALVTFQSVEFGRGLDLYGLGSVRSVTPYSDYVNLLEVSLDSAEDLNALQNPEILVARVTFMYIAAGEGAFAPRINAIGDAWGDPFSTVAVVPMTLPIQSATPVPEPAVYQLMIAGLIVIGAVRWRLPAAPTELARTTG